MRQFEQIALPKDQDFIAAYYTSHAAALRMRGHFVQLNALLDQVAAGHSVAEMGENVVCIAAFRLQRRAHELIDGVTSLAKHAKQMHEAFLAAVQIQIDAGNRAIQRLVLVAESAGAGASPEMIAETTAAAITYRDCLHELELQISLNASAIKKIAQLADALAQARRR